MLEKESHGRMLEKVELWSMGCLACSSWLDDDDMDHLAHVNETSTLAEKKSNTALDLLQEDEMARRDSIQVVIGRVVEFGVRVLLARQQSREY